MTVTTHANVPVPPTVAPQLVTVPPTLIETATVRSGVNPPPETVTATPLGPCVGERLIAGEVIVNVAVAESKLPSDPVAVNAYAVVDAVPVISTRQLKSPVPPVAAPQYVSAAPEPIMVATVTPGVKPLPSTVIDAPLGPCDGDREIVGWVTVKVALAESFPRSDPVAVTEKAAGLRVEIVTEQLNEPPAETVAPQPVTVAPELIVVAIVFPGVNPVPEAASETPLGPCVGESASDGVVTV